MFYLTKKTTCLYIFKLQGDMYNFISGRDFDCIYKKRLNSYVNITLPSIIKGNNETHQNNVNTKELIYDETSESYKYYNPLNLFQVKLIYNSLPDILDYNMYGNSEKSITYFSLDIPITRLYKFSSAYEEKIMLFKKTIEKITGYKIIYA